MTKRGLDSQLVVPSHFTTDELRDLFTYNKETKSDTHDKMGCQCGGTAIQDGNNDGEPEFQAGAPGARQDDQLVDWTHLASPVEKGLQDPILSVASPFVSFVMMKNFFSDSQVD